MLGKNGAARSITSGKEVGLTPSLPLCIPKSIQLRNAAQIGTQLVAIVMFRGLFDTSDHVCFKVCHQSISGVAPNYLQELEIFENALNDHFT